jgi:splicing suppressor protein 51
MLGARAESSLPAHVWEQLTMLFPASQLHLIFVGPQVSLPKAKDSTEPKPAASTPAQDATAQATSPTQGATPSTAPDSPAQGFDASDAPASESSPLPPSPPTESAEKPIYTPNVYEPPTPKPIVSLKRTRSSLDVYGVPSYTTPFAPALTLTGLQATYMDVHAQFQDTLDPYSDVFFLFSPGFGFPSPTSVGADGRPLLQIASPTEWGPVLPTLLASKCAIFVTGFSPADVERDVKALAAAPGVAGEFDWLLTPGPNAFGSEKWEVADFDPRVMVKTNWGIWGIRGKRRDVRERSAFSSLFGA